MKMKWNMLDAAATLAARPKLYCLYTLTADDRNAIHGF